MRNPIIVSSAQHAAGRHDICLTPGGVWYGLCLVQPGTSVTPIYVRTAPLDGDANHYQSAYGNPEAALRAAERANALHGYEPGVSEQWVAVHACTPAMEHRRP